MKTAAAASGKTLGSQVMMPFTYFRGAMVPSEQANIPVQTHGFNYGTGCFEGIRVYVNSQTKKNYILHLMPHIQRFFNSCKILRLRIGQTPEQLRPLIIDLATRNQNGGDFYIRPLAYKSHIKVGIWGPDQSDDLTIFSVPFGNYIDVEAGIRVMVSSWTRMPDNVAPARAKITGTYVNSFLARTEAAEHGYDEAIFLDAQGHVCEGSAENIFLVRGGKLITPSLSTDALEGITRESIIELAQKELGLTVVERSIDRSELYVADEILLCGTGAQISPVVHVDHCQVGDGQVGQLTRKLQEIYFGIVRGKHPKYQHWLTEVPAVGAV